MAEHAVGVGPVDGIAHDGDQLGVGHEAGEADVGRMVVEVERGGIRFKLSSPAQGRRRAMGAQIAVGCFDRAPWSQAAAQRVLVVTAGSDNPGYEPRCSGSMTGA